MAVPGEVIYPVVGKEVEEFLNLEIGSKEEVTALLHKLCSPPAYTTIRFHASLNSSATVPQILHAAKERYLECGQNEPEAFVHPVLEDLLVISNHGPHVLQQCDKEVMVDVHTAMSVLRGSHVFAQGVMGMNTGVQAGHTVSVFADIDAKCLKGLAKKYPGRKLLVGNGKVVLDREQLFGNSEATISGVAIQMTEPLYTAPSLSDLATLAPSTAFPQNLPSVVAGHVLDVRPGMTVIDLCAAPGGKTTHLAALMRNQGRLVGLDKSASRVAQTREAADRLGCSIVELYVADSTKLVTQDAPLAGPPPYPPASFDRVLLDAPCSALGQRPALKLMTSCKQLASYPKLQRKIFSEAVRLLRPGGILVYSTCTITVQENEGLVAWALRHHDNLRLDAQTPYLGVAGRPHADLDASQAVLMQRFDPSVYADDVSDGGDHVNRCNRDTIGFFIAKFILTS